MSESCNTFHNTFQSLATRSTLQRCTCRGDIQWGGLGIERHRLLTREAPCQQTRFNLSFSKQWLAVANQSVSVSGLSFFSVCDFTVSVLQGFIYNYIAAVFFDTYLPAGFTTYVVHRFWEINTTQRHPTS